ncbi:MAG: MMPL family transporter [Paludibacteraceae bacterium]|nr:MMPL family transporter [Paludibacteraceae bacterium]
MAAYIRNIILVLLVALFAWLGAQCVFEENIFQLLPQTGEEAFRVTFENLRLKDKIFVQAVPAEGAEEQPDPYELAEALDLFLNNVVEATQDRQDILYTLSDIDPMMLIDAADYLMAHTPAYVDFTPRQLDSLCSTEHIRQQLLFYQDFLETDLGQNLYDAVSYDPCGIALGTIGQMLPMDGSDEMETRFQNNHLYGRDAQSCIGFMTPGFGVDNSREAKYLVRTMNRVRDDIRQQYPNIDILYHGTVILSGGNSERMSGDIYITVSIALLIISILLAFCLKRPMYLVLTLAALLFGTLLALAVLYLYQGGVSIMSMGIGAIVLGVAFSYVLHVLIHYIYTGDVKMTMKEQTKPVLLGSLTTIGAFAGLLFTQSRLLSDFGFFALLVIIGTTAFSLVFMPHFLPKKYAGNARAFRLLERINAYPIDRNKTIVALTVLWVVVCIAFSGHYQFDSDLNHIGYFSDDCLRAEDSWAQTMNDGKTEIYFASIAPTVEEALEALPRIEAVSGTNMSLLMPSLSKQEERIAAWENYFTPEKQAEVGRNIVKACEAEGIDPSMFLPFQQMMAHPEQPELLVETGLLPQPVLDNLYEQVGNQSLVYFSVTCPPEEAQAIKDRLSAQEGCMVMDPYYYCTDLIELLHDDFNLIMWISSAFVFLLLLISYRNIWLTLIALSPMVLSWYTVLGAMALFHQPFNLVNIIVSSFVFGIGVDYSIFILEGLLKGENTSPTMMYNKTAITLSAVILIICMLILGFAQHPAVQSISFASLVGMITTIMLSYTLEPNLYRLYQKITNHQSPITNHQ